MSQFCVSRNGLFIKENYRLVVVRDSTIISFCLEWKIVGAIHVKGVSLTPTSFNSKLSNSYDCRLATLLDVRRATRRACPNPIETSFLIQQLSL